MIACIFWLLAKVVTLLFWLGHIPLIILCMKPFSFLVLDCGNVTLVGNGFCNDETNNADCNYDGGDCCGPDIFCKWPWFLWKNLNPKEFTHFGQSKWFGVLAKFTKKLIKLLIVILKNNHKLSRRFRLPSSSNCYLLELFFKWIKWILNFSWEFVKYIYNTNRTI